MNTSCIDGNTYRYLDDEGEGLYRLSFAPCFIGGSMNFLWRVEIENHKSISIHNFKGDLNINATNYNRGRYHVKVIASDECNRELSLWVTIEINKIPIAKAQNFPVQQAYIW